MKITATIRISGQIAVVRGLAPFEVRPADPTRKVDGYVMVDSQGVNCVRFSADDAPVIFMDRDIAAWMATDLSSWR